MPESNHSPKVFISYSHDSEEHKKQVLAFANRLREEGVDCMLDQYQPAPPEGWPRWMEKHLADFDFVLMICTEIYHKRVTGKEEPGKGFGVCWEGNLIYNQLYSDKTINQKYIPVLFDPTHIDYIPLPLKGYSPIVATTQEGYEELYRYLTNQPATVKPSLGKMKKLNEGEDHDSDQWNRGQKESKGGGNLYFPGKEGEDFTPGEELRELVRRKIGELLGRPEMAAFGDSLLAAINQKRPDSVSGEQLPAALVETPVKEVISRMISAINEMKMSMKKVLLDRESCETFLGWLVLLTTKNEWVKKLQDKLSGKAESLEMEVPGYTDIGFSTTQAAAQLSSAQFKSGKEGIVYGKGALGCGLEAGPQSASRLEEIKRSLYLSLLGRNAPTPYTKVADEEIKAALDCDRDAGNLRYFPIGDNVKGSRIDILRGLREDLPELSLILLKEGKEGMLILPDLTLRTYIQRFLEALYPPGKPIY